MSDQFPSMRGRTHSSRDSLCWGAAVRTLGIQLDGAGVGAVNLVIGGLLYVGFYLTLAPILGAVEKQGILNLRTLLGHTRIVAVLVNPVFDYESKLLSAMKRK